MGCFQVIILGDTAALRQSEISVASLLYSGHHIQKRLKFLISGIALLHFTIVIWLDDLTIGSRIHG